MDYIIIFFIILAIGSVVFIYLLDSETTEEAEARLKKEEKKHNIPFNDLKYSNQNTYYNDELFSGTALYGVEEDNFYWIVTYDKGKKTYIQKDFTNFKNWDKLYIEYKNSVHYELLPSMTKVESPFLSANSKASIEWKITNGIVSEEPNYQTTRNLTYSSAHQHIKMALNGYERLVELFNQKKPNWFKGKIYENGQYVENPISKDGCKLTNIELSIYDYLMGLNTMVQEKVFSDKTEEEKQLNNIQLCLEWFKYNNLLKYLILFENDFGELKSKKEITKWLVKVDELKFSNGFKTNFFELRDCVWWSDDEWDIDDLIEEGTMYKGNVLNYDELTEMMENEEDAEHIDSSQEEILFFDTLKEAKEKFDEFIKL